MGRAEFKTELSKGKTPQGISLWRLIEGICEKKPQRQITRDVFECKFNQIRGQSVVSNQTVRVTNFVLKATVIYFLQNICSSTLVTIYNNYVCALKETIFLDLEKRNSR